MKNFVKVVLFWIVLLIVGMLKTSFVSAEGGCVPVYGGGVQCPRVGQVLIDKSVRNPSTGVFVDNLNPTDPKYRPDWLVTFKIVVRNSGDESLYKVTVKDVLPDFIALVSGPGNFDSNSKTLTFDVYNLLGGTSQTFNIVGRVVQTSSLPEAKNTVCVVNNVEAVVSVDGNGSSVTNQKDSDSSQFCIEKVLEVPTVPDAGPEHWILSLAGLGSTLTAGLVLRKKSKLG